MADSSAPVPGHGASAPLSPLIHGRARLLILARLAARPGGLTFTELKVAVGLTDGTLSVHLSKLEAGKMVSIRKEFVGKKPRTLVRMTAGGRRRFATYIAELQELLPGFGES